MTKEHSKHLKSLIGLNYKTQFFRMRQRFLRLINKSEKDQRVKAIVNMKNSKAPFLMLI